MALPVAASDLGGIPEVVSDGETGFLAPPRDPEALARAMLRLMEEPEAGRLMGRRGRERVAAQFSLERMAERVELVYDGITGAGQVLKPPAPAA
jgi:glycosyltransferase involved in cell wall biosynthesis